MTRFSAIRPFVINVFFSGADGSSPPTLSVIFQIEPLNHMKKPSPFAYTGLWPFGYFSPVGR